MNFEPLKEFMDHLTSWRIPGNCIRVAMGGKEVFRYESGYSDLENKVPMTGEGLFNIYSCSKPITVTAALQLYEKGMFLLDDPLYEYIPEYKKMYVKEGDDVREAKNPITMRNLLTMTAGFIYSFDSPGFKKAREITGGKMDTLTVAKCVASDPLHFEPGTKWQYSICHDILGAAIEAMSGMKFRDYVKKNVFEPLGMNDSYYHNDEVIDRVNNLYRFVDGENTDIVKLQSGELKSVGGKIVEEGKGVSHVLGAEFDSGGAGITTSLDDYMKFANAMSLGGIGTNGERILSEGAVELMKTNQITEELMPYLNWSQLAGYGYGLGVRTMIDRAKSGSLGSVGEFGWGGAAGATFLADTDMELAVFYTHHLLNPQETYYQPRLKNVIYNCLKR